MGRVFLVIITGLCAVLSSLTWLRAPDFAVAWKAAILAGEFGHWLVIGPIVAGAVAVFLTRGKWRIATVSLAAVATAGLVRPALTAWTIGRELPAELRTAFGSEPLAAPAFSWARLYAPEPVPAVVERTEVFARPDGEELALDVFEADGVKEAQSSPPCLVVIHGGGWDSGERTQFADWNRRWAARGWVVASVSYRLAPRWIWPAQREDVLAAIAWLKANAARLHLDATRFALIGRSAGAQLATAVGYGANDPAIRGVVALYGPHDMPFAWSISREDDTLNSVRLFRQYFGGAPDTPERRARYESASGQLLAHAGSPPTLLIHGTPDTLAWWRHSERLAARLQALAVPHYLLRLPWATHGFDFNRTGPGGQLADYAIESFLRQTLRR